MGQKPIKYGEVFKQTQKAFNDGTEIVIQRGGTGSGKTFDIMIFLLLEAFQTKDKIITIVSESVPHLEIGALRILRYLISHYELNKFIYEANKKFTFPNKTIIEFFSADRIEKALGARRHMLFCNEVNSLKYNIVDELTRRSEKIIFDFNPTFKFWLEDKFLIYYNNHQTFVNNYLVNPFLPPHEKERIQKRSELDPNFYRIHIMGEYGSSEDLVFTNINLIDNFPNDVSFSYGLDFGYVAPSSLVKVAEVGGDIYIEQIFYLSKLSTSDIIEKCKICGSERIYADSEDARMIMELSNNGLNVFKAFKPAGSVRGGISYLQGKKLHITKTSIETIKEFREYLHDKNNRNEYTGNYRGEDHSIDATRYALQVNNSSGFASMQLAGKSQYQSYHDVYG